MKRERLDAILAAHQEWLDDCTKGSRADLSRADLRSADLGGADLSGADLRSADLGGADLRSADLSRADLRSADLGGADLSGADLSGADLRSADLSRADLSRAVLFDPVAYIADHFKRVRGGIEVYKTFGAFNEPPTSWVIEPGSIIAEVVNPNPTDFCGCGVNVATREWCEVNTPDRPLWRCLIRWEWMPSVVVPYNTDGKIRAGRVQLVERLPQQGGES